MITKKSILLLFIILTNTLTSFANGVKDVNMSATPIIDELIQSDAFITTKKHIPNKYIPINDELLEHQNTDNSVFKLNALKENEFQEISIEDELLSTDFISNAYSSNIQTINTPDDFFIEKLAKTKTMRKIHTKTIYDFSAKPVHIHIKLANHFDIKKQHLEGDEIPFESVNSFKINDNLYPKGTLIIGRVETVSAADKMGVPEDIKIDNFYIPGIENINLHGSINKSGANRAIWVYPLYQAGNICLYAAGFIFVPIHGGKVKFSLNDTYTVFYENNNNALQNCYN